MTPAPDPRGDEDEEIGDVRAADSRRAPTKGAWLDADELASQRERRKRRQKIALMIERRDREGLVSALRDAGLNEADPEFVEILRLVPSPKPGQAPGRKR